MGETEAISVKTKKGTLHLGAKTEQRLHGNMRLTIRTRDEHKKFTQNTLERYGKFSRKHGDVIIDNHYLVGGIPTPLKNMKVNWDCKIPNRKKTNPKYEWIHSRFTNHFWQGYDRV